MRRVVFITLFLAAWTVFLFGHTHAIDQNLAKGEYVAAVNKQLGDDTGENWYVTQTGYIAAVDEELLDRALFWAVFGNEAEFEEFISSSPLVFPLKGGLSVRIEKFSFAGKVRIRPKGSSISVWTVREAIRLNPIHGLRIPRHSGHPFHAKAAIDSTPFRPLIL